MSVNCEHFVVKCWEQVKNPVQTQGLAWSWRGCCGNWYNGVVGDSFCSVFLFHNLICFHYMFYIRHFPLYTLFVWSRYSYMF